MIGKNIVDLNVQFCDEMEGYPSFQSYVQKSYAHFVLLVDIA
jgi:hypothetical protein